MLMLNILRKKIKCWNTWQRFRLAWYGTPESLLEASEFIAIIEKRQGLKIGCIEEIAYRLNYIDKAKLKNIIDSCKNTSYSKYLLKLLEEWILLS